MSKLKVADFLLVFRHGLHGKTWIFSLRYNAHVDYSVKLCALCGE